MVCAMLLKAGSAMIIVAWNTDTTDGGSITVTLAKATFIASGAVLLAVVFACSQCAHIVP